MSYATRLFLFMTSSPAVTKIHQDHLSIIRTAWPCGGRDTFVNFSRRKAISALKLRRLRADVEDTSHSQLLGCTASLAPGCSAPVSLSDPGVWASWPVCVWSHPLCASSGCLSLGSRKSGISLERNTYKYKWIKALLEKIKTLLVPFNSILYQWHNSEKDKDRNTWITTNGSMWKHGTSPYKCKNL